jgi:tetratricopeptide (TPR) repeat protein
VQGGNHTGFGRLTFDYPAGVTVDTTQDGDTLILRFEGAAALNLSGAMVPRNVVALSSSAHEVTIGLAPGVQLRRENSGRQFLIDIMDAPAGAEAGITPPAAANPAAAAPEVAAPPASPAASSSAAAPEMGASSDPTRAVAMEALPPTSAPGPESVPLTVRIPPLPYGIGGSDMGASEPPAPPPAPAEVRSAGAPPARGAAEASRAAQTPPTRAPALPAAAPGTPAPSAAATTGSAMSVPLVTPPSVISAPPASRAAAPMTTAQPAPLSRPAPPPVATSAAAAPGVSAPGVSAPGVSAPGVSPPPASPPPSAPESAPPALASTPSWAPPETVGPANTLHLAVGRIPVPAGSRGAAINLPFSSRTAAAAYRRGEFAVLVFDESRPLDLADLRSDPIFGSAAVQLQENATVVRMRLPAGSDLRLAPVGNGWNVWVGPLGDKLDSELQPMPINVGDQQLEFAAADPGRTLVVPDPDTGGTLLVGTQRKGGQGVVAARRTPDFIVLQTFQGVAIEPFSDRPQLRVAPPGLILVGEDRPLALSGSAVGGTATAEAAGLTRRVDLPALAQRMLWQRLQNRVDETSATPPLSRLPARRAVAEAMLALGMGPEAQGEMRLAVMEDPRGADDPDTLALGSMAAMVAHRPEAAAAIDDKRLTGTDEIRLWRAIRRGQMQAATAEMASMAEPVGPGLRSIATDLAATAPLAVAYPELLRNEILPLVMEMMVLGGQTGPAAALLAKRPEDVNLTLARAYLARAQGDNAAALAAFDRLARSRDRLLRFRGALAAIDLRLSTGAITAAQAADAAEKLLFAWRGDDQERALRVQIAAWRMKAGQWRQALAMLRESTVMFPEQKDQFRRAMTETLRTLMRDERVDGMDSLELISLLEENIDLLPDGAEGQAAAVRLADRMQLLDLDQRAEPVLERLAKTTPNLSARAAFGVRLAALRLDVADAEGALAALAVSGSDALPPGLVERRSILGARADAVSGRREQAVATLTAVATPAADLARAAIEETAKEWPGAAAAMAAYVGLTVPPSGVLTAEQSHAVLRFAADLAQAGDDAGLSNLHTQQAARMADGPDAAAFRLLTESPVRDVSDLPRAAKEIAAAHAVVAAPK